MRGFFAQNAERKPRHPHQQRRAGHQTAHAHDASEQGNVLGNAEQGVVVRNKEYASQQRDQGSGGKRASITRTPQSMRQIKVGTRKLQKGVARQMRLSTMHDLSASDPENVP